MSTHPLLSDGQVDRFINDGVVTVDTPLTADEVAAARQALDDLFPGPDSEFAREGKRCARSADFFEPALVHLIEHPWFEAVAKQVLRAEHITFNNLAIAKTYPNPGGAFTFDQHIDVLYTMENLTQTPRRMACSFFIWLDDVNAKRAPLMVRPGSHMQMARWQSDHADGSQTTPLVRGVMIDDLPDLGFAPPSPIEARAGQASVLTTAVIHGPSSNVDTSPRYSAHLSFVPRGCPVNHTVSRMRELRDQFARDLRAHVSPSRQHLLMDDA